MESNFPYSPNTTWNKPYEHSLYISLIKNMLQISVKNEHKVKIFPHKNSSNPCIISPLHLTHTFLNLITCATFKNSSTSLDIPSHKQSSVA